MSIEHSRHPWGNWLRTVKAARGSNVLQTGQAIADDLQGQLQVEDLTHLVAPLQWTQSAFSCLLAAGGAGTYTSLEIRAVQPFWLRWWYSLVSNARIYTLDAHVLATADTTPASVFGEPPQVRYRTGTVAAAPPATAWEWPATVAATPVVMVNPPGLFVPQGKILSLTNPTANQSAFAYAMVVEVPSHLNAP